MQARLVTNTGRRDARRVPTLDQAAWEYFEKRESTEFRNLKFVLDKMMDQGLHEDRDANNLKREIRNLYRTVIRKADFIATTPVAAFGEFSDIFKPKDLYSLMKHRTRGSLRR